MVILRDGYFNGILKGDFVNLDELNGKVRISKGGQSIGKMDVAEFGEIFKTRKNLKGIIKNVSEDSVSIKPVRFADLHRHSGYSLLDGGCSIKDLVSKTEEVGAITDHGIMSGVLEYYKKMKSAGKTPILGFEAYTESITGEKESNHLLLLAKNEKGFKNLTKLTSKGFLNFYRKPHLSYDMLREHSEGVVATSACMGGEIAQRIMNGDYEGAKEVALILMEIFGKEDFYIEIQRHGISNEERLNLYLVKLARELGLKYIAATDSHFPSKEDYKAHEVLLCIGSGKTMEDEKRFRFSGSGYHIHTADEMEELFSDFPEALDATLEIAEKCAIELNLGEIFMPHFPLPSDFSDEGTYFESLCWEGFKKRFEGTEMFNSDEYRERLQFEIETINRMKFPGYFIIVWDFVKFAKTNSILVGPGRGSACGSLVAYVLDITEVDPIPHGLLFERFLNVDRVSMPDIDIDFDDERREEVIDYVKGKYGEESVSRIITFGTLGAKAAVRDVTRVLGKPYSLGDRIAKTIPKDAKMTLSKALEESVELGSLYRNYAEVKEIVDMALKVEGLPRNMSQHACGLIIAPSAVNNYIPQVMAENKLTKEKELTTQLTMTECEEMGLLKVDFLGLRTMGVISNALKNINKRRAFENKDPLTFMGIPTDDVKVYDFISKGNTQGVFQLESPGMTSFMKEMFQDVQANSVDIVKDYSSARNSKELNESFFDSNFDIYEEIEKLGKEGEELNKRLKEFGRQLFERTVAGISLYRPGPIDEIPNYIKNMLNPNLITYETPRMEPLLKNTYGIIVYQEQCMFIVRELAGFGKGMADNVRKAMAKKKDDMLEDLGNKFVHGEVDKDGNIIIDGCLRRGISQEVATSIWEKMKKFGRYAFNKSHAVGYAEIAIRTAWLSYYYPTEYMAATLNSFITASDKIKLYMSACKKKGIDVLPPNVNESDKLFSVNFKENAIRFGLMGIRNMGAASESIIREREARGPFSGYQDFTERMAKYHKLNKKVVESLIFSGAVDNFPGTRRAKLSILEKILLSASAEKKTHNEGQITFFSMSPELEAYKLIPMPDIDEFDKKEKLLKEKEYAGFYVTEHPMDAYMHYFKDEGIYDIGFLQGMSSDEDSLESDEPMYSYEGETVRLAGVINDANTFYTKKDQKPIHVFQLEDKSGEIKCVLFSDKYGKSEEIKQKINNDGIVIIQGKIKTDDFGSQVIIDDIYDIEAIARTEKPKAIWLKALDEYQLKQLNELVSKNVGDLPIYVKYKGKGYKTNNDMTLNFSTMSALQDLFGDNIKPVY